MRRIIKFAAFFLIAVFLFASCKKDKALQRETNRPPVANAGVDQIIILPIDSTELSGSGTDQDGNIVSYEWTKINGPAQVTLINSTAAITKVRNLIHGVYEFELKVTDNNMLFATDRAFVLVLDSLNDPLNAACAGCWDY